MQDCLFCKIVSKEIESDIVFEDDNFIAFKDIDPKAAIHILTIPKKHIASVNDLQPEDKELIGELLFKTKELAKQQGVAETGYRLIFNTGIDAGQSVEHLHLHVMGGEKLPWP